MPAYVVPGLVSLIYILVPESVPAKVIRRYDLDTYGLQVPRLATHLGRAPQSRRGAVPGEATIGPPPGLIETNCSLSANHPS